MSRVLVIVTFALCGIVPSVDAAEVAKARENFKVAEHNAFVIEPVKAASVDGGKPWVWYAPTLGMRHPNKDEGWMVDRFAKAGIAIAGIDVGESYGSPKGRALYQKLYEELTTKRGYSKKPVLLARSRGGLMLYSWAVEHPESVGGIVGIYPVCNIASYPGIARAAPAYEMTPEELEAKLAEHNPIDRIKPLAMAKVPIFHIQGDSDRVVPHEKNTAILAERYRAFGGPMEVELVEGQGHNMWRGWFESERLTNFAIVCALGKHEGAAAKPADKIKPGGKVTLRGKLEGGIAAIGGETTGWMLTYLRDGKPAVIDVDMSGVRGPVNLRPTEVTITGTVYIKDYVERGPTSILKAESIKP